MGLMILYPKNDAHSETLAKGMAEKMGDESIHLRGLDVIQYGNGERGIEGFRPLGKPHDKVAERMGELVDVRGQDVIVMKSFKPGRMNMDFVESLLMLTGARDYGARSVHFMSPNCGFLRQDSENKGEALGARMAIQAFNTFSDSITMVEAHPLKDRYGKQDLYDVTVHNIDAVPALAEKIRGKVENPVFIAGDEGSIHYNNTARRILGGGETYVLKKSRHTWEKVKFADTVEQVDGEGNKIGDITKQELAKRIRGRDVVLVDDVIATGGTQRAVNEEFILPGNPKSTTFMWGHGEFLKGTSMFYHARLLATNTIRAPDESLEDMTVVDVTGLLAERGKNIRDNPVAQRGLDTMSADSVRTVVKPQVRNEGEGPGRRKLT